MKSFFIIFTFIVMFSACADKNAFDKFNFSKDKEVSINNTQSSKIQTSKNIDGVVRAIYLNNIYPDIYNDAEYFYIYAYYKKKIDVGEPKRFTPKIKSKIATQDSNNTAEICKKENLKIYFAYKDEVSIYLNNKLPIKVKELEIHNEFSYLTSSNSDWQRYYLVTFKQNSGDKLGLKLKNGYSSSDIMIYLKDK